MDHLVDFHSSDTFDLAIQGRDNTLSDGVVESEGVANGQCFLADLEGLGVADCDGVESGGFFQQFQNRSVFFGNAADDLRFVLLLILVERDHKAAPSGDDVVVGDDVPALVPDESGTGSDGNLSGVEVEPTHIGANHPFAGDVDDGFNASVKNADSIFFALKQLNCRGAEGEAG